jgi:hypothetical protein
MTEESELGETPEAPEATEPLDAMAMAKAGDALMRKADYRHAVDKFRSADEAARRLNLDGRAG